MQTTPAPARSTRTTSARRSGAVLAAPVVALTLLLTGCFLVPGDPATSSLIKNATGADVQVEVVLDQTQWRFGFEPEEYEVWLDERTDEWFRAELEEYEQGGTGTELVDVDLSRWVGVYTIAPDGTMVVDDSLGDGPNVRFAELIVTTAADTSTFVGQTEILPEFDEVEDGLFVFTVGAAD
jgi:hypothetical protein